VGVELEPKKIELLDLISGSIEYETQLQIRDAQDGSPPIDLFAYFREGAKRLICLLPSAQPASLPQQNPVFHRWSWFNHFPECHIVAFSDPGLYSSAEVRAAWFMGRGDDLITELARNINQLVAKLDISLSDVVVYGSSMGGFGALMLAAELRSPIAVAEVPQLDMRLYPIKGAIQDLEEMVLNRSLESYYAEFPERVSVLDRFSRLGVIPKFKIVTNRADPGFREQIDFLGSLAEQAGDAILSSDHELLILADDVGHKPLTTGRGVEILRSVLNSPLRSGAEKTPQLSTQVAPPPPEVKLPAKDYAPKKTYRQLIDAAVDAIERIKFLRNDAEKVLYEGAKRDLYAAALLDPSADWPYRRLCSLIKSWTNSFNQEFLLAAEMGLDRKETLESFIYACQGLLYNNPPLIAEDLINDLIESIYDAEIANVGRIFQALSRYEVEDYGGYAQLIEDFKTKKSSSFEPYIAIPVSTVVTCGPGDLEAAPTSIQLVGTPMDDLPAITGDLEYVVTVSCDEVYFRMYAEFLVTSFSRTCSPEAMLVISVLTKNRGPLDDLLETWGARNVVLNTVDIAAGENVGPIASLVRFSTVYPLLLEGGIPVVVLDLDTVLTNALGPLVAKHGNADICSRVLGGGVAPWEKFTGGFAIFYPTEPAIRVAGYMASAASRLAVNDRKQWWIDQNCFEAGIRMVRQEGGRLAIDNVMAEREAYCVMPVGTGIAKTHTLKQALQKLLAAYSSQ